MKRPAGSIWTFWRLSVPPTHGPLNTARLWPLSSTEPRPVGFHLVLLRLGNGAHDLTHRALVMGIANRTSDSFFDKGAYFSFDRFLERAESLVAEGADVIDVGGVKAGPGPEVGEAEELDRVVPAVEALASRFDVPVSVDTWRASVAAEAFARGAVMGNDISGFSDPGYLPAGRSEEPTAGLQA